MRARILYPNELKGTQWIPQIKKWYTRWKSIPNTPNGGYASKMMAKMAMALFVATKYNIKEDNDEFKVLK